MFHIMKWVKRIFKGSKCKILKQQYHEPFTKERIKNGDPRSQLDLPTDEREDIHHSTPMPLLEDERKQGKTICNQSHLEKEQQVSKASQKSLSFEFSTHEKGACAGCKTKIGCRQFHNYMGTFWHLECFCCYVCDQPIHDHEFSMFENYPYHKSCYEELHHMKCDVCKQFITSNCSKHRFFHQIFCNSHWSDGTPYCSSCQRMKPRDTKCFTLDDGRILCFECQDTIVIDNTECQVLYLDIQEFFESLSLKVTQQIPLLVVEREALNEAKELEKNELWHLPKIRGLCIPERTHHDDGERSVDITKRQTRLTYRCNAIAILILYGLPRLMMGSILAHEMMHAWLAINGYYPLSPEVEEGICQVVAHMWLDSEIMSGSKITTMSTSSSFATSSPSQNGIRSQFEKRLGYFFKGHIELHTSPIYGDGFRACNQAVLQYGLKHMLEHVRLTGKFPK